MAGDAGNTRDGGDIGRGGILAARGGKNGDECRGESAAGRHGWALTGAGSRLLCEDERLAGGCDRGGPNGLSGRSASGAATQEVEVISNVTGVLYGCRRGRVN